MSIGSMIRRHGVGVIIKTKASEGTDSSGSITEVFSGSTTVKAFVDVQSSSDDVVGGAERSTRVARIYFEGSPTITIKDRVEYASQLWEVTSVITPAQKAAPDHLAMTVVEAEEVFN